MKAVLNGPQGKTALESMVLTIGSSPDNSLVIDNLKVSAHHAEIRPGEQGFSITDLGSIHGTYVNGERLDFNTPHMLNQGNSIAIGDMVFTYDVEDAQQNEPTPSTTSDRESSSGTLVAGDGETLAAHSAYGIGQMGVPQGDQQLAGANTQYTLPQQYMPSYPTKPDSPGVVHPGYVGPVPAYVPVERGRRRNRLFIWIGLGLLVVIASALAGYVFFTRSTPEKTLDTFCNAMQGQDYQIAYNQLASSLQSHETENVFAHTSQAAGKVNVCTHGSATVTGNLATANVTFVSSSGQTSNNTVTLTQDSSSTWKISMLPTSPSMTLAAFCSSLQSGDYPTAYNQLSSGIRGQRTESQFEADFAGLTCSYGIVSLSGNTATTAMMFTDIAGRSVAASASLAQDSDSNNEWKIVSIRFL